MNNTISVIVPIYKVEKYLPYCIESIIAQTYKHLEIILVDDGSPDACPQICDEYASKDKRIRVIHKANGGLSDARNVGIEASTGEYLCFVDSDDTIHPRMCEILYDTLVGTKADISMCSWKKVFDISNPEDKSYRFSPNKIKSFTGDDVLGLIYSNKVPLIMVAWAKLYKKKIFKDVRYPVGKIHEDEGTIHYVLKNCKKLSYIDFQMYNNTQRDDSITAVKFSEKRLAALEFFKDRIGFFEKVNPKFIDDAKTDYVTLLVKYYFYSKWNKLPRSVVKGLKKEIKKCIKDGYSSSILDKYKSDKKQLENDLKNK